jgi:2,4-dienoyl-CoA reductase-like NADH-dependent reductase (Old Yellow Enzyme family)/thioredoxin reductase
VKTVIQLYHSGRQRFARIAGGETISPSGIPCPVRKDPARAPTIEEIHSLVEDYGQAARRAKEAGFDGIEIHCAHGYLLSGFLSPAQNKRTDEYGGDVMGRSRIVREILARCREIVGDDMLFQVRMNGSDYVNDGNTPEETRQIAKILVDAGCEVIHVSAGMAPSAQYSFLPSQVPRGFNVPLAEDIKSVVDVPVIACGAITDAIFAEEILARGKVDLVAMGRPLFADPDLPNKSKSGKLKEIRPCLRCSKGAAVWPEDMRCTVNPRVGREAEYKIVPTDQPKKVVVVGAGPGGLESAKTLAERGHSVTLIDERDRVGGKILMVRRSADKQELERWLDYYENEMERLPIQLELNRRVTADDVIQMAPDAVVVATGARPLKPSNIEGIDNEGVVAVDDILWGNTESGDKVLIVGGHSTGVETALYLAEQGKRVVVVEMEGSLVSDISHDAVLALMDKLDKLDYTAMTDTVVTRIERKGGKLDVHLKRYGLESVLTGFDSVVLAAGVVPENQIAGELKERLEEVFVVGDCEAGGDFRKAVLEGADIGLRI